MAEVTPASIDDRTQGGFQGLRLRRFRFEDLPAAANTWTHGIRGIQHVAWEPDETADVCTPTYTAGASVVGLTATGGDSDGWLWVWSNG